MSEPPCRRQRNSGGQPEPVLRLVQSPAVPAPVQAETVRLRRTQSISQGSVVLDEIGLVGADHHQTGSLEPFLASVVFAVLVFFTVPVPAAPSTSSHRRTR